MNLETVLTRAGKFNTNIRKHLNEKHAAGIWLSELYCYCRYGCSPDDYFRYQFYRKSGYERNKFITYRRSRRIIKQYNDTKEAEYLYNKTRFNTLFADFINRDWINAGECTRAEFDAFLRKHREVLMKPLLGGQGKGIYKLTFSELSGNKENHFQGYIAEEIIRQHHELSRLNPSSVNTVRVMTFMGKAIAGALRIGGTGALVDNLHSNGVCAHLDLETGMIDSPCINNDLECFLFHPGTGTQLIGFKVPDWEAVIATAEKAAAMVPHVQYIGWDIAVTENGPELIEGNEDPGHDVVQMIAQTGLYEEIRRMEKQKS